MSIGRLSVIRRSLLVLVSVLAVAGCTPKLTAMPMLLESDGGGLTAQVPICAYDWVTRAAVYVPFGTGQVEHRGRDSDIERDRVMSFRLSAAAVAAGSLTEEIPVTQVTRYRKAPVTPGDLGTFVVHTGRFRVAVDLRDAWALDSPSVLVYGVEGPDTDYEVRAIDPAEGRAMLDGWCEANR